jgi:lipopolysaccharide/colanic/teichoic acid biosynthesis glycosyltransferase
MREVRGAGEAEQTSPRSYRLTGVGRLLRRTRLDEIPQLFNVLRGDLSFVGPRPERNLLADRLRHAIPPYALRFMVKPGLTGWAQVQHRFGMAVEESLERLKYDLYYVKNMSFRLDLFVVLKTLKLVLFPAGR